jgi:hypothetical protein
VQCWQQYATARLPLSKVRTSLIVESTGVAGLRVHDENSKVRTALTATHDGSAILGFLDKDGKVTWKAP